MAEQLTGIFNCLWGLMAWAIPFLITSAAGHAGMTAEPVAIGSRLEPFVDDFLIERMTGAALRLHHPTFKDVALAFDKPWEGNICAYVTIFKDGDKLRMYYRGVNYDLKTQKSGDEKVCYAESVDGIRWIKPELNLFEYQGSKANNIVWSGQACHNFSPFRDQNPACTPDARYKALGGDSKGLLAFKSPDGIHWSLIRNEPVITKGAFDSQNIGFWDAFRGRYVEFHRLGRDGVRDILTGTSTDFLHWTDPVWLDYGGATREHLYTNAITVYHRAPHIFFGFPKRFVPGRTRVERRPEGVSDGVFMTSRDGIHFHRWQEALIRPGLQKERWVNRNNMIAWGIVETKSDLPGTPNELSIYSTEGYYVGPEFLRRHTIRLDGFVSINAPFAGGEMITKPLMFDGKRLVINYSTSAAGSVKVEMQDEAGKTVDGYALADCPEIYGDDIEQEVAWKSGSDVSKLAGKPVRLRFVLKDADLYSLRFAP